MTDSGIREDFESMKALHIAEEIELMEAQKLMSDIEFDELVKKLRQLGLEDGDLGYARYDKLIDKLKAARKGKIT